MPSHPLTNPRRLASQGCRFTDAHTPASSCTPTRYSLLTGQYAWRHQAGSRILPGTAPLGIPTKTVTLPRLLKQSGYATGIVGKWHLGLGDAPKTDYNLDLKPEPLELGFDTAFIIPATGGTNDSLFSLVDMAATLAALTGVPLPAEAAPDSCNELPVLLNEPGAKPAREDLVARVSRTFLGSIDGAGESHDAGGAAHRRTD